MTDWSRHFSLVKMKGDRKVQTWRDDRSGLSADIYLRGTRFVALFLEEMFEAPDVAMLRKKLRDKAEHWITMQWHPMIEVAIKDVGPRYRDEAESESIELKLERYYVSASPTGELFKVGWDVDETHRKASMDHFGEGYRWNRGIASKIRLTGLPLKAPLRTHDGGWLIDYNEQLWDGFEGVQRGIRRLRKRLEELVGTRKGIELLLRGGNGAQLLLKD